LSASDKVLSISHHLVHAYSAFAVSADANGSSICSSLPAAGCMFGPRALGNRSPLADPRKAEMKDVLNKRVKHRQAFRPFAPIVLAERAKEIFEGEEDSPFMLIAKRVRPEWRDRSTRPA
jgi:predicted NodU family carbamoyl transferase